MADDDAGMHLEQPVTLMTHLQPDAETQKAVSAGGDVRADESLPAADQITRPTFRSDLNLGVIGNSSIAALIDRHARIVWCCYPHLDGDPIFYSLLNGSSAEGSFEVCLDRHEASEQEYLRNTAILVTTLKDRDGGMIRVTDFVPRFMHYERLFRPTVLVRIIEPIAGSPRVAIRLRPGFEYGEQSPDVLLGSNHIRYHTAHHSLRLETDAPISYVATGSPFVLEQPVHLILGPDEEFQAPIAETARSYLASTERHWIEWVRDLSIPFDWQEPVIRAAITLKLCSFEETGAIVAAMTTSIPEAPDTERNWDYRFCWLRDAYFVVQTLNRLGTTVTMEHFIHYITNVAVFGQKVRLNPVYGIVPRSVLSERVVTGLEGYRGMGPVRVGNAASGQIQNDVYGSLILAAAQMFFDRRLPKMGDRGLFYRLEELGEWAAMLAFEPDASLWEYRGRARVHTYSSVMCWAACDRLAEVAVVLDLTERAEFWRQRATSIRTRILDEAWDDKQNTFVESLGGTTVDASLLLLQEVGFVSASDPRFLGTLDAIERRLRHGNHIYRYEEPDDFGQPATAFTVCTFWFINALAAVGRLPEARVIFEDVLACCNHVGLLSEDVDPRTGELWGNFPQSYSLVGLIVSAMRLSRSWEEAFWRGVRK